MNMVVEKGVMSVQAVTLSMSKVEFDRFMNLVVKARYSVLDYDKDEEIALDEYIGGIEEQLEESYDV